MGSGVQIQRLNLGLKQKIWTTITIVAVIAIVFGTGLTYYLYEKFYVEKQKEILIMQGEELRKFYYKELNKAEFKKRVQWTDASSDAKVIFTEDPMLLSAGIPYDELAENNLITFDERQRLLAGKKVIFIREHPRFHQDILAVTIPLLKKDQLTGALFLYMPLADIYEPFKSIRIVLAVSLVLLLSLVVWMGHKMTNRLIKPLKEMETISRKMSQGDFSKRIEARQTDEVGNLAASFNTLASSLEAVDQKRREFLQNVSHELRTPLSYMKGYTEAILDGVARDREASLKYVSIIHNETERLQRLVHDLLDLAQLEGDSYPMKDEPLPFAQLISEVADRFELSAQQKAIQLVRNLYDEIIVNGDSDRLEQVVSNLLDNAIRYAPKGKPIRIILTEEGPFAVLMIQDFGPGISKEDLPKVVERFYRVDRARSRKEGGTGLGLAIVFQIVKKHYGELNIESEEGGGTTVVVKLPLFE
ncbi:sensor histidine kinase [Neobacillus bataviensis LMG 21833]|uniref:histidine kinase n=1 Tax=Neobacillus bataviensis LMG 21833 TaxID=1117379 RepID=K6DFQ1_9BACI|nr:HAMP domain-containing sensor histidine kinase [Neobacillus bataviensis]EKN71387.1 sensor histidine kinase [Neobacillus bataviensis LMG 21833]